MGKNYYDPTSPTGEEDDVTMRHHQKKFHHSHPRHPEEIDETPYPKGVNIQKHQNKKNRRGKR